MILTGDWIEQLQTLPSESVQCCVTSPPYWGLRDYKQAKQLGTEKTPAEYVSKLVAGFEQVRRVLKNDGTIWLNLGDCYSNEGKGTNTDNGTSTLSSARAQEVFACKVRKQAEGLKRKDLVGIPWLVAFALRDAGWYLRSDIVWAKPNCMPESVQDRPTRSHEYIFLLTKRAKYFYNADAIKEPCSESFKNDSRWNTGPTDRNEKNGYHEAKAQNPKSVHRVFKQDGHGRRHAGFNERWDAMEQANNKADRPQREWRNKRDVWTVSPACFKEAHFATFPPDLIKPCILAGSRPGDTVLDPFFGSGTTGLVATELGREYIGIELNPDYVEMANRRCNVTKGLPL